MPCWKSIDGSFGRKPGKKRDFPLKTLKTLKKNWVVPSIRFLADSWSWRLVMPPDRANVGGRHAGDRLFERKQSPAWRPPTNFVAGNCPERKFSVFCVLCGKSFRRLRYADGGFDSAPGQTKPNQQKI
jgi:hypothetical protein